MNELEKLKQDVLAYCDIRKAKGGKVAEYKAPCCGKTLVSVIPDEKGDKWDSAVKCYECGELHFVVKTVDGITANKLE